MNSLVEYNLLLQKFFATLLNSQVIRQKGESQNGGNKNIKHPKFSENRTFLTPDTHTYVLRFLLLRYYRRIIQLIFFVFNLLLWKASHLDSVSKCGLVDVFIWKLKQQRVLLIVIIVCLKMGGLKGKKRKSAIEKAVEHCTFFD